MLSAGLNRSGKIYGEEALPTSFRSVVSSPYLSYLRDAGWLTEAGRFQQTLGEIHRRHRCVQGTWAEEPGLLCTLVQ